MRLKYRTIRDDQYLTVEDIARRTDGLEVEYRGKEGTLIEGPEENFREIVNRIENKREKIWEQMTGGISNSKATELDNKRSDLRDARNRLQDALSNSDHRWRE